MAFCRGSREQFLFYLSFDFVKELWIVFQEIANCITALPQLLMVVRQPGSRFFKHLMLNGNVNDTGRTRNSLIEHNIEFRSFKRSGAFVFYDFKFYTISNYFLTFFDRADTSDIKPHGRIELKSFPAWGSFGVAEHDSNFLPQLIDEDNTSFGAIDTRREFSERLRHQTSLEAHLSGPHF